MYHCKTHIRKHYANQKIILSDLGIFGSEPADRYYLQKEFCVMFKKGVFHKEMLTSSHEAIRSTSN